MMQMGCVCPGPCHEIPIPPGLPRADAVAGLKEGRPRRTPCTCQSTDSINIGPDEQQLMGIVGEWEGWGVRLPPKTGCDMTI